MTYCTDRFTRLDYCQFLVSSPLNYSITHFADHAKKWSHENLFGRLDNSADHQSNHRCPNHCLRHFGKMLVVSNQTAIASKPAECTFNYPSLR